MANIPPIDTAPDEIVLPVYYRLKGKTLSKYEVCWPVHNVEHPLKNAITFCRAKVLEALSHKDAYNLAVLAVIRGGKA